MTNPDNIIADNLPFITIHIAFIYFFRLSNNHIPFYLLLFLESINTYLFSLNQLPRLFFLVKKSTIGLLRMISHIAIRLLIQKFLWYPYYLNTQQLIDIGAGILI